MKAARRVVRAASILLASAVALSCNNAYGIFQNVQGEQKQTGTSVFQEVSVSKAFRLGNNYYAALGSLQTTPVGQDSWSKVAIGVPPTNDYSLRDAVLVGDPDSGGMIYALIETGTTGTYTGTSKFTVSAYSSIDGANWTAVTLPAQTYTNSLIDNLDALYATSNGRLFAEDHSYNPNSYNPNNAYPSTFTLYFLQGGSLDNKVSNFSPASPKTIRGVVFDGSKYWFASEDKIYSGTDPAGSDAADASGTFPGVFGSSTIWDISYAGGRLTNSPGGYVYLTMQNGYVFRSDGSTSNPTGLPLTQVIEVPSASGPTLLVGSDTINTTVAAGYFEGTWNTFSNGGSNQSYDVAGGSAIFSTTVSTFPVHSFYYDGTATGGTLFVCVAPGASSDTYHGLYLSKWNSDPNNPNTWSGWSAQ